MRGTAVAVIVLNLLVATVHGWSHAQAGVPLAAWQKVFVLAAVYFAPLVALILSWTPLRATAAATLFLSMTAALLFGLYHHFGVDNPDHVSGVPATAAGHLFVASAALLVLAEVIGAWLGAWWWCKLRRVGA